LLKGALSFKRNLVIYPFLFLVIYGAVMLFKYLTNDEMTWTYTFVYMLTVPIVLALLKKIKINKR